MEKKNLIILPTYNERRNIEGIVAAIFDVLPETHILIVDDNSPDGTGRLADSIATSDDKSFCVAQNQKQEDWYPPTLMVFVGLSTRNTTVFLKWMPTLVINQNTSPDF